MSEALLTKTFTAELVKEGSWGVRDIGKHESTMSLYEVEGNAGRLYIEWDVPALDLVEEIGIWVEMVDGKRTLCDYDGVCSLPSEAIGLLEEHGITVPEEFR